MREQLKSLRSSFTEQKGFFGLFTDFTFPDRSGVASHIESEMAIRDPR